MNKLLFITKKQFGYHTGIYKYTQYLEKYDVIYLCFDTGKKKYSSKDIEVLYVKWSTNKIVNAYNFFISIYKELKSYDKGDQVFIVNFQFCFMVTLFNSLPRYILDIRTLAVTGGILKRTFHDVLTKINTNFFDKISVISPGVAGKLKLKGFYLLPVGADIISSKNKSFELPKLLYIGTFNNRNLSLAVEGYCRFIEEFQEFAETSEFHIVGDGYDQEVTKLRESINEYDKYGNIIFHGYRRHNEVRYLFDECNIGVSFVPKESYYEYQPPTKNYEYLLSGLICIATKTTANEEIIDCRNGVLCEDNPDGIYASLLKIMNKERNYDSETIRNTVKQRTWANIVHEYLEGHILDNVK